MIDLSRRRRFLSSLGSLSGAAFLAQGGTANAQNANTSAPMPSLPAYALAPAHKTLKQSSYDRTGGNADYFHIAPGESLNVFQSDGPGIITHIWFTINAHSQRHLK